MDESEVGGCELIQSRVTDIIRIYEDMIRRRDRTKVISFTRALPHEAWVRPSLSSLMTTKKIAERSRSLAGLIARRGVAAAQPHPDLAMNAPLESLPFGLERLVPSQHVLINAMMSVPFTSNSLQSFARRTPLKPANLAGNGFATLCLDSDFP